MKIQLDPKVIPTFEEIKNKMLLTSTGKLMILGEFEITWEGKPYASKLLKSIVVDDVVAEIGKDTHNIKLNGKVIGQINPDAPHRVSFMVIKDEFRFNDGNPSCKWMWVFTRQDHNTLEDAKDWATDYITRFLLSEFKFYTAEN